MGNYYESFNPPFFLDFSFRPDLIKANRDGYNRRSEDISNDIMRGLVLLAPLTAPRLKVEVNEQNVTLSGSVPTLAMARYIERMSINTLGVRNVESKITIQRAGASAENSVAANTKSSRKSAEEASASDLEIFL
jgi:hypothetical protein